MPYKPPELEYVPSELSNTSSKAQNNAQASLLQVADGQPSTEEEILIARQFKIEAEAQ